MNILWQFCLMLRMILTPSNQQQQIIFVGNLLGCCMKAPVLLFRYTYTKQQLSLNLWRLAVFYRIVQDYQTFLRLSGLYDWIV